MSSFDFPVALLTAWWRRFGEESPVSGDDLARAQRPHIRPRKWCTVHAHCGKAVA